MSKELDSAIATDVMGWQRMTHGQGFALRYPDRAHEHYAQDDRIDSGWHTADGAYQGLAEDDSEGDDDPQKAWSPSTDIAAAWTIVEQFPIVYVRRSISYATAYEVTIYAKTGPGVFAEAETAPLAICLAALKAIEKQHG